MKITLLSDTHGYFDLEWYSLWEDSDEVWHAGDFGNIEVMDKITAVKPLRGVWGNIDNTLIRASVPEYQNFKIDGLQVLMIHIGGYPQHYSVRAKTLINEIKPDLFICGHSHILKVIYDQKYQMLTINPGAAGKIGWHKVRTMVRFQIDAGKIHSAEIIELGGR